MKRKKNTHMVISIDAEKALDKIQHPLMIKTLNKLGIEGNDFNIIKVVCEKTRMNIMLSGERLKAFSL